jgi:hypothetical protein
MHYNYRVIQLREMRPLLSIVGGVVGVGALTWGIAYHDLLFTSFFAPKYETVRRNTYEQSKSFRTGAVQELQNMRFEYIRSDAAHKLALKDIIIHRAAEVPEDAMPQDLYNFIQGLKTN